GPPWCYCSGSSRPPDSPKKSDPHESGAAHGPASARNSETHGHRTGKYSGRVAEYSYAKARGSAEGCVGKPAGELRREPDVSEPLSAPRHCATLQPGPRPSASTPLRGAPR